MNRQRELTEDDWGTAMYKRDMIDDTLKADDERWAK